MGETRWRITASQASLHQGAASVEAMTARPTLRDRFEESWKRNGPDILPNRDSHAWLFYKIAYQAGYRAGYRAGKRDGRRK